MESKQGYKTIPRRCMGCTAVLVACGSWCTQARNRRLPTFLYAMPFSDTRIFLEETSLVARPAVPFPDLKVGSSGFYVPHVAVQALQRW